MDSRYPWLKVTGSYCFERPTWTGGWQGAWCAPSSLPILVPAANVTEDSLSFHSTSLWDRAVSCSLEELYLFQQLHITSEEPPSCPHKMCRSVSMANIKPCFLTPLKEGPRESSLSKDRWMTEASANMVSYKSSSEMVYQLHYSWALFWVQQWVIRTDSIPLLRN